MNFRSISDMRAAILRGLHRLPPDLDVIVGIPRSGMLAASIIALDLNLPLTDVDSFATGRRMSTGTTRRRKDLPDTPRHALLVDDTARTGNSMTDALAKLSGIDESIMLTTCVVYSLEGGAGTIDIALETVPVPRIFEWNIMHHPILGEACVDIDGVLCHDPTAAENDDGEAYLAFLRAAKPLTRPSHGIATLVTSRLEKYRDATEEWLRRNGVEYGKLVMLDLPTAEARWASAAHGKFKGAVYKASNASIFIESDKSQAIEIANISGKAVLCMSPCEMHFPGGVAAVTFFKPPKSGTARNAVKRLLGPNNIGRAKRLLGRL